MPKNTRRAKLTPEQRAEIARQNGAKSRGPVTEKGKTASSRNAEKHGIYTRHVVLGNESEKAYLTYRQRYMDQYEPADVREEDLVLDIVNARWRLSRILLMETAAIDCAMTRQRKSLDEEFKNVDEGIRTALGYIGYNGDPGPGIGLLGRAESRLMRVIARSTRMLEQLQAARAKNTPAPDSPPQPGAGSSGVPPAAPDAVPSDAQSTEASPNTEKCKNEPGGTPRMPRPHATNNALQEVPGAIFLQRRATPSSRNGIPESRHPALMPPLALLMARRACI